MLLASGPCRADITEQQAAADQVRAQGGSLTDKYRAAMPDADKAAALTGTDGGVERSRTQSSGGYSGSAVLKHKVRCNVATDLRFSGYDRTRYTASACTATSLQLEFCTPDTPTGGACPGHLSAPGSTTYSYNGVNLAISIAPCADPATEKCDHTITITEKREVSWEKSSIETDGQAAAAASTALGSRTASKVTTSSKVYDTYNGMDRVAMRTNLSTIERSKAATLSPGLSGAGCEQVCVEEGAAGAGPINTDKNTKQCTGSTDSFATGCVTDYPTSVKRYDIARVDSSCAAHRTSAGDSSCTPASSPPSGYGPWMPVGSDPSASDVADQYNTAESACYTQYPLPSPPVNGSCGSANGQYATSFPSGGYCGVGSVMVTDNSGTDGTYNWACNGSNGGMAAACSAPVGSSAPSNVSGSCGSANGATVTAMPSGGAACATGTLYAYDAAASDGTYDWACEGRGSGSFQNCSATLRDDNKSGRESCIAAIDIPFTQKMAAFEQFTAMPTPSKPYTAIVSTNGQPVSDPAQCVVTGQECASYDLDVPTQCRVWNVRDYCPKDAATTCQDASFVQGSDPSHPPAAPGGGGAVVFSHPGPDNFTLADGRKCGYADDEMDEEAVQDGAPTCNLFQDGVCVQRHGTVECEPQAGATGSGPPDCSTDPAYKNCTAKGAPYCSQTSARGTCAEMTQDYECTVEYTSCLKYQTVCSAGGVEYSREDVSSENGFAQGVAQMEMVDQITSQVKDNCAQDGKCDMLEIRLFSGKAEQCVNQVGASLSSALCKWAPPDYSGALGVPNPCPGGQLRTNCCDKNVNEEQNNMIGGDCDEGDIKLAAAKRQNRAYRGPRNNWGRCSKRLPWPFSTCIERTEAYCYWPSVMAKAIGIQGRAQLKAILGDPSTAVAQNATLDYDFFAAGDTGQWTAPLSSDGRTIVAWQWPAYCNTTDTRRRNETCGNGAASIIASCDKGSACGAPPSHPITRDAPAANWMLTNIERDPPAGDGVYDVGRFSSLKGKCAGTHCNFAVTFSASRHSGMSVGVMELSWPWADPEPGVAERVVTSQWAATVNPNPKGTPMAATHRIGLSNAPNISAPEATTYAWFDIPTNGTEVVVNVNGKDVRVQGQCDARSGLCSHRFYVPREVTARGWNKNNGSDSAKRASDLDCDGFTLEEFDLLDIAKMDLSEAIESMTGGKPEDSLALAHYAVSDFETKTDDVVAQKKAEYNAGQVQGRNAAQYASTVVTLTPAYGKAPWTTTLIFPNKYPDETVQNYNTDPNTQMGVTITGVTIDWGDGGTWSGGPGSGKTTQVKHTYEAGPGKVERDWDIVVTFTLAGNHPPQVHHARAASRYDEVDLSRRSGGAEGSVRSKPVDTRPPASLGVPSASGD